MAAPTVRVELLGPLRLTVAGEPVDVPGPKRRAALVLLALAEGRAVTVDALVTALWGEVPDSGRQALHTHVSRLRTLLGPAAGRLTTLEGGYRLALDESELDVARARALLHRARSAEPAAALPLLREAHALWRGPVLADLTDVGPIAIAVEGQRRLREEIVDALVAGAVAAGEAGAVVGLAEEAHSADRLREPAAVGLMRALAANGRAADALRIGREHRRLLAAETGLDPSSALADAEREIAAGAPAADPTPRPATRLIGRDTQVAGLLRLLGGERMVTVAGPGGVGKTRVALEVARRAGAPVVLLAPVTAPDGLPHALAAALRLSVERGDVLDACLALLGDRPGVVVLDNCEHLRDAAAGLAGRLLAACPRLSVLATSREPLGLPAEYVSRLDPLPVPGPGEDPGSAPAVAVFLDRARRVRSPTPAELPLVADVVRRLDGMPLAIELAAGRLSGFTVADLHARLDRALDLLGGPRAEARHATLRATVDWSYRLLTPEEQRLFRYLAVFPDGLDLAGAEELAAGLGAAGDPGALLARLVDASMLTVDFTGRTRYRMLETLRAYGIDRIAAEGEGADARDRLSRRARALAADIRAGLAGPGEAEADTTLRRELPTLRAAWRAAREQGDRETAEALVVGLLDAVAYRDLVEIRQWAEELAADSSDAAVLGVAAEAAYHRGDHATAERWGRAALAAEGDRWLGRSVLAVVALARGELAESEAHSLAAAEIAAPGRENLGVAALAAAYAGDLDRARVLNDRGAAAAVAPSMRAWSAYVAAEIAALAGDSAVAERNYRHAVDLARGCGATFLVGVATVGLLSVLAGAGRVGDALRGYSEVVDAFARTGNWTHLWATLRNLADVLRTLGDAGTADLLDAAADQAPDAPAVPGREPRRGPPVPGRHEVLDRARQAVARQLSSR